MFRGEMETRNESTRKQFSNWLQCICCLNDTKTALHDHVVDTWKKEIMSWDKNIRIHIPVFFNCVSEEKVKVKFNNQDGKKTNKKGKWVCDCKHLYCNRILEKLLALQQNPGFNIVWNSNICEQLAGKGVVVELDEKEDFDMGDDLENIPRVETALLTWKKDILSLDKDIAHHIPRFLSCVSEERIKIQPCTERTEKGENIDGRKTNKNGKWFSDCEHLYCNAILKKLLALQNPDFNTDDDNDADESKDASKIQTSPLALVCQMLFEVMGLMGIEKGASAEAAAEEKDYKDIFDDCTQKHIWCIANMFMQRGKKKTNIPNNGPENTDASMFFKMTKNCKLFEIENGDCLYDGIIHSRDLLHHSANNRVPRDEAKTLFSTMVDLLKAFPNVPKCVDAIQKTEKMLKETILSVSVPDGNLKELAGRALKMKKAGLQVDQEFNIANGDSNDDTSDELKDTEKQIEAISNPQSNIPLNEVLKSRDDYNQEILDYKNRFDEMHEKIKTLENENQTLKRENEKGPGIPDFSQSTTDQHVRMKDPGKHFENMTKLVKMYAEKKDILEALTEQLNPLLDQIVEDASGKDEEIKESLEDVYEQERHESERETEDNVQIGSDDMKAEDVDVQSPDIAVHDDFDHLKSHTQLRSDSGVTSIQANSSHVWCVESEQSYTIKVEGDRRDCLSLGCCMLPTGEILLADCYNCRLKKLNDRYQVISVCDLPDEHWDVCYCGINEAVLAMGYSLQFVDVTGGMSLTRNVRTDHPCNGLTCHGNQLYVVDDKYVYIYSTDGIKQRVLYTNHSHGTDFWHIAVSDDSNYIYITDYHTGLHTIDSVGNQLYTLTDTQLSEARAVCVDGEGHVLVSQYSSNKLLQVSSDGKQKLGIIVANISIPRTTICFNRSNATLIGAGLSNKIHVFKLK